VFVDDSMNTGEMVGTVNNTNFVLCRYNLDQSKICHSIQIQGQSKHNSKDCVLADPVLVSKDKSATGWHSSNMSIVISIFHRAFFNSIIDKHQHMHLTFNSILV